MLCQSKSNPFVIDSKDTDKERILVSIIFFISSPDPQQTLKLVLGNTSIGNDTVSDVSFNENVVVLIEISKAPF